MKHFLLCLLLLTTHLSLCAQNGTFEATLLAGVNLSQIDGDRLAGFNQPGLNAGMRVNALLSDRWEAGIELNYSQQGSNYSNNDDPSAVIENLRLNFIEAPVLLYFNEWKFKVHAGLIYSRLINYKAEDIVGNDITDNYDFNNNVLSVGLGAAYQFDEIWGLEARWSKFLTNLQADSGAGTFLGRSLTFRMTYRL